MTLLCPRPASETRSTASRAGLSPAASQGFSSRLLAQHGRRVLTAELSGLGMGLTGPSDESVLMLARLGSWYQQGINATQLLQAQPDKCIWLLVIRKGLCRAPPQAGVSDPQ